MGVEVGEDNDNKTTDAQIKGNIYAASDYYNKDYNDVAETKVTNKYESKPSTMWGTKDSSAYSGIFVNGKIHHLHSTLMLLCVQVLLQHTMEQR